eukprot:TRINITY_DN9221_c0_g1_i1.p1 TRINITY_DN9221_c0_g1~~TRINITY_DN9221_c0_g1_i1.p1  ORF type:complete len:360 (+),score=103.52 TRINITY_DN9221_c0_g1_i1:134-1081(+)
MGAAGRAAALLLLGAAVPIAADTSCDGEVWGKSCPAEAPTCCFQRNGVAAGCCKVGFRCDLGRGDCVADSGSRDSRVGHRPSVASPVWLSLRPFDIVMLLLAVLGCLAIVVLRLLYSELRDRQIVREAPPERRQISYQQLPQHLRPEDSGSDGSVPSDEEDRWLKEVCARRAAELTPPRSPPPEGGGTPEPDGAEQQPTARRSSDEEMHPVTAEEGGRAADPAGVAAELPTDAQQGAADGSAQSASPRQLPAAAVEDVTCRICFEARVDCLLLDCAHLCVCYPCARHLKVCPFCRKAIRKRKRILPEPPQREDAQ